jgi:hypothetical protein
VVSSLIHLGFYPQAKLQKSLWRGSKKEILLAGLKTLWEQSGNCL